MATVVVALLLATFTRPLAALPAPLAHDEQPVRVWLSRARVYVQTSAHGYLVVLRSRTDGGVEVLFPGNSVSDPFVRAGTYEIRAPGDGAGGVMVLAALSPDALWFDEFARGHAWDRAALSLSDARADAVAALTDIVQRMVGAGSFNYDFATYAVAPPPVGLEGTASGATPTAVCVGCSFTAFTILVAAEPAFARHPRLARCFPALQARHRAPADVAPAPPPDVVTASARGTATAMVIAGISTAPAAPAAVPATDARAFEWEPRWVARAVRPVDPVSAAAAQPQTLAMPLAGWRSNTGGAHVVHTMGGRR